MGAGIRMPGRVLLPCLAVSLVASGAAAAGIAGASRTSGYLMRQADNNLLACASSMLSRGSVAAPGSGPVSGQVPPGACGMELLSADGQVLTLAASGTALAHPADSKMSRSSLIPMVLAPPTLTARSNATQRRGIPGPAMPWRI